MGAFSQQELTESETMLERDLADKFADIFCKYTLLTPINNAQAGWPDRFIQLPNSRVVAAELKIASLNTRGYFVLTSFRQTQAAWLAKWQRKGGLGFLFVGVTNKASRVGCFILSYDKWDSWLDANTQRYYVDNVKIYTDKESIVEWFEHYAGIMKPNI